MLFILNNSDITIKQYFRIIVVLMKPFITGGTISTQTNKLYPVKFRYIRLILGFLIKKDRQFHILNHTNQMTHRLLKAHQKNINLITVQEILIIIVKIQFQYQTVKIQVIMEAINRLTGLGLMIIQNLILMKKGLKIHE